MKFYTYLENSKIFEIGWFIWGKAIIIDLLVLDDNNNPMNLSFWQIWSNKSKLSV